MLIVAVNPGHDGAITIVRDRELLLSVEAEKDSFIRHRILGPQAILRVAELVDETPDGIAVGGWFGPETHGNVRPWPGYYGAAEWVLRDTKFFGRTIKLFSSTHERS